MDLDKIDRAILRALGEDARISIAALASRVGLSATPTQARMKRLEKDGYIKGYTAILDADRLGLSHIAFVEVKLDSTSGKTLEAFNAAVQKIPEIEQAHLIAGSFDYLLKVRTRDINDYRRVLGEVISTLPHVQATSTNVSMQAVKEDLL